jgi:phosphoribosylglycinamide formyltransferase-1
MSFAMGTLRAAVRRRVQSGGGRTWGEPRPRRLRVAVLTSHRTPGLGDLLRASMELDTGFEVVTVVASHRGCRGLEIAVGAGVPVSVHDVAEFCAGRGTSVGDRSARPAYDRATLAILEPFRPDLVLLCGYLLVASPVLLEAFAGRILNVHDADLRLRDAAGRPRYHGLHATRDAILAGEPETRTTLHLATEELDAGPPLLVSGPYPVHSLVAEVAHRGAEDVVRAYAYAHRGWMMETAWGPMMVRAAELFARGAVELADDGFVVDGRPGPASLADTDAAGRAPVVTEAWIASILGSATGVAVR